MKTDSPQFFFLSMAALCSRMFGTMEGKVLVDSAWLNCEFPPGDEESINQSIHPSVRLSKDEHECAKAASCMSVGGWVEIKGQEVGRAGCPMMKGSID